MLIVSYYSNFLLFKRQTSDYPDQLFETKILAVVWPIMKYTGNQLSHSSMNICLRSGFPRQHDLSILISLPNYIIHFFAFAGSGRDSVITIYTNFLSTLIFLVLQWYSEYHKLSLGLSDWSMEIVCMPQHEILLKYYILIQTL